MRRSVTGSWPLIARLALLLLVSGITASETTVSGIAFAQSPAASGESTHVDVPSAGKVHFKPDSRESSVPRPFRLTGRDFEFTSRLVRTQAKVRLYKVTFPSPIVTAVRENNTVHAEYFQPEGRGPFPACVVLHILGGDFLLSETIAQHLAHRGIAALFVKMPYYGERRGKNSARRMISPVPAESVAGMTQGVQDIRCATAWLAERPEVNRERLGITGISLGESCRPWGPPASRG